MIIAVYTVRVPGIEEERPCALVLQLRAATEQLTYGAVEDLCI